MAHITEETHLLLECEGGFSIEDTLKILEFIDKNINKHIQLVSFDHTDLYDEIASCKQLLNYK